MDVQYLKNHKNYKKEQQKMKEPQELSFFPTKVNISFSLKVQKSCFRAIFDLLGIFYQDLDFLPMCFHFWAPKDI